MPAWLGGRLLPTRRILRHSKGPHVVTCDRAREGGRRDGERESVRSREGGRVTEVWSLVRNIKTGKFNQ